MVNGLVHQSFYSWDQQVPVVSMKMKILIYLCTSYMTVIHLRTCSEKLITTAIPFPVSVNLFLKIVKCSLVILLHYIFVYWIFALQTCLVGAGPEGKHTALEAVTVVLDLPPPQPGSMSGLTSIDRVSASDPKSALALQRLVQAAVSIIFYQKETRWVYRVSASYSSWLKHLQVWFLGENANYAAYEYAWESATPPGTALMMLDADKMVAAASSRNPTLAIVHSLDFKVVLSSAAGRYMVYLAKFQNWHFKMCYKSHCESCPFFSQSFLL